MPYPTIPHIIPVLSGKGGVGKSSVTAQLALSLSLQGHNVGVLDIDLTGPSIPRLFGIEYEKVRQAPGGWTPVTVHPSFSSAELDGRKIGSLYCMSLGFLLRSRGDAVIWRGPKKTAMVNQLLSEVLWPEDVEYLLVDTPPGTSDEHISLVTNLLDPSKFPVAAAAAAAAAAATSTSSNGNGSTSLAVSLGAVIVTTPQAISTADVRKELTFCKKVGLKVLGVVENMAGYVCPCCGETTNVFSKGGGQIMAAEWGLLFLGSLPLDGQGWGMLVEEGKRPRYGSVTATQGTSNGDVDSETQAENTSEQAEQPITDDNARLVEKYTSCSLAPLFANMVEQLYNNQGAIPEQPQSNTEQGWKKVV